MASPSSIHLHSILLKATGGVHVMLLQTTCCQSPANRMSPTHSHFKVCTNC